MNIDDRATQIVARMPHETRMGLTPEMIGLLITVAAEAIVLIIRHCPHARGHMLKDRATECAVRGAGFMTRHVVEGRVAVAMKRHDGPWNAKSSLFRTIRDEMADAIIRDTADAEPDEIDALREGVIHP